MTNGINRAIQTIKVISATYQHSDVLIVLERGENALKLIKLIDEAFDGKFLYDLAILDITPEYEGMSAKYWTELTESNFLCVECGKEYKTKSSLKAHYTRKHPEVEKPDTFPKVALDISEKERISAFKKWLVDNPRKVLILQRDDDSTFIGGQRDIRPLKYLGEDDVL